MGPSIKTIKLAAYTQLTARCSLLALAAQPNLQEVDFGNHLSFPSDGKTWLHCAVLLHALLERPGPLHMVTAASKSCSHDWGLGDHSKLTITGTSRGPGRGPSRHMANGPLQGLCQVLVWVALQPFTAAAGTGGRRFRENTSIDSCTSAHRIWRNSHAPCWKRRDRLFQILGLHVACICTSRVCGRLSSRLHLLGLSLCTLHASVATTVCAQPQADTKMRSMHQEPMHVGCMRRASALLEVLADVTARSSRNASWHASAAHWKGYCSKSVFHFTIYNKSVASIRRHWCIWAV